MENLLKDSSFSSSTSDFNDDEHMTIEEEEVTPGMSVGCGVDDGSVATATTTMITPTLVSDNALSHCCCSPTNKSNVHYSHQHYEQRRKQLQSISRWQSTAPPMEVSSPSRCKGKSHSSSLGRRRMSSPNALQAYDQLQQRCFSGMDSPVCPVRRHSLSSSASSSHTIKSSKRRIASASLLPLLPSSDVMPSCHHNDDDKTNSKTKKSHQKQHGVDSSIGSNGSSSPHLLPRSAKVAAILASHQHAISSAALKFKCTNICHETPSSPRCPNHPEAAQTTKGQKRTRNAEKVVQKVIDVVHSTSTYDDQRVCDTSSDRSRGAHPKLIRHVTP